MPSINRELVGCSVCGQRVPRRLSHRNRAGAYVCRTCQARARDEGYAVELYERGRVLADRLGSKVLWILGGTGVALAVALIIVLIGD